MRREMNLLERFYPETRFGGFTDIDGNVAFYSRVNALLNSGMNLVDFGCGSGSLGKDPVVWRRSLRVLKGKVARVIGLDVDQSAQRNPFVDEFRLLQNGHKWPLESTSVDFVLCDSVLEHLPEPEEFFQEASRVLKANGLVAIRTPNVMSYFGLVARLVPATIKAPCLRVAQPERDERDVYPAYYRCNTVPKIRQVLQRNGFEHTVYCNEPEPGYLSFSNVAYALGVMHQRFAPRRWRVSIFAFGRVSRTWLAP